MNQNIINFLQTWGALILGSLSFILGTGWLKLHLEFKRKKREWEQQRYRTVHDDFLKRFEGILHETRQVFDELRDDPLLPLLEHHPGRIEAHFQSLPKDDLNRLIWRQRIQRLLSLNNHACELIDQFRGRMVLNDFKAACAKFEHHTNKWEDLWKAVENGDIQTHYKDWPNDKLVVEQFPPELEAALQDEITEVKRRAGLP